jgi:hypothetical protein
LPSSLQTWKTTTNVVPRGVAACARRPLRTSVRSGHLLEEGEELLVAVALGAGLGHLAGGHL